MTGTAYYQGAVEGVNDDETGQVLGENRKFSRDVAWNVASLGVSGVAGIALNYLISELYGPAALGSFNQVFAVYILCSQVAALGVHLSALQRIAVVSERAPRMAIATSAVVVVALQATLTGIVFYVTAPVVAGLLDSEDVRVGMTAASPGIVLFALNKVLAGCLNGLRRMRWYAMLTAGRFVAMLVVFAAFALTEVGAGWLPLLLSMAELATLVLGLIACRDLLGRVPFDTLRSWATDHIAFGSRGFMSGVLSDLNTRVDVLMLGYFASDSTVGVYSFAAILAEGFFQLLTVLRSNYAPILAKLIDAKAGAELLTLIRRGRNRTYFAAIPIATAAVAGYALIVPLVTSDPRLDASWMYFGILACGIVAASGYIPFSQILLHGHRPGWHTWFMLAVVGVNAMANALLIPQLGATGAAVATAAALAVSVPVLRVLSRRLLSIPL